MLIGQFSGKISKKGRTAVPKKFRTVLGQKIIVTQGYEKSLIVVSAHSWNEFVQETKQASLLFAPARETDRFLLGGAFEVELDEQGRFVIPAYLREYAGMEERIVFVGLGGRVEIWSHKHWSEYQRYLEKNIEEIAKQLSRAKSDED